MRATLPWLSLLLTACAAETPADDMPADTSESIVEPLPEMPDDLTRWLTGSDEDAPASDQGPGLILMGGGLEPDEAFTWWTPRIAGGDVVVVRASGSDGYNDYLYSDIGGVDSVETLLINTAALANDPWVAWRVAQAEGVFIAGGDQWDYLSLWSGSALQEALQEVYARGAVLGGTSAGLAVLGDWAFSAENGTVYSDEALEDPFNTYMTFSTTFLELPMLEQTITDSHLTDRDRLGRLITFVARMQSDGVTSPRGLGIDETTALILTPEGEQVVGEGAVFEVAPTTAPERCEAGVPLEWADVPVTRKTASGETAFTVSAAAGVLEQ